MKHSRLAMFLVTAVSLMGVAEAAGPLLTGNDVTEVALIRALTPGEQPRTRGFSRDTTDAANQAANASLLVTFATNSAELTVEGAAVLDKVGLALKSDQLANYKFNIEGHADPRGTDEFNLQLSEERAVAVRQYLVQNYKIAEARLTAIGKGESELMNVENPIAPENRRVTIKTIQ
ncbi:MAG: OmpA family protein [Gammaproteobacteria bacterium]|nr:OmpA family protein [Gammaproteobacteria bacterium]